MGNLTDNAHVCGCLLSGRRDCFVPARYCCSLGVLPGYSALKVALAGAFRAAFNEKLECLKA
jgi:hypothetical protein